MAESSRRIKFAGTEIEVENAEIASSEEYFNEYRLKDGSVVRIKGVLVSLVTIVGQKTPEGKPIYLATLSPVVVAI
jgi:hypothetical protein